MTKKTPINMQLKINQTIIMGNIESTLHNILNVLVYYYDLNNIILV